MSDNVMAYDEEFELTRYVWGHCAHYLTPHERLIGQAIDRRRQWETAQGTSSPRKLSANDWTTSQLEESADTNTQANHIEPRDIQPAYETRSVPSLTYASTAIADEALRRRAALRVLVAQAGEIRIPRCPRCERVLTNQDVPACYWCGLDWHDGRPLPKARR